ncbi:pentapeptide repeat-containing protein [Picosynechococcus sp. NKBG042902]|uniref:pentapeptide repeat-containing protein n=1 Tax=Picosynechococcus sp. NKBG042902 TaxID=490193 RepID=UPI0004AA5B7D|nr:pentapeptide repeat-containing protein [Picosynechococcus sp. NKBG042902]
MPKRFKPWQPKEEINKGWTMGAIALPVVLWMMGCLWWLPGQRQQANYPHLSQNENVTLVDSHRDREILTSDLRAIAAIVGGIFLFFSFRRATKKTETTDFCGADLNDANFCGADLNGVDFCGASLIDANFSGANLSGANFNGANLNGANLNGANLSGAALQYANLSGVNLRYANLSGADLRYANLSDADLNCTLLSDANLSEANLSGALLFFINSRDVLNLEPIQLKAEPSPFLCNVALPTYAQHPKMNPNRDCNRIPRLLSDRYDISLEEAQGIVEEARQHHWD